MLRTLQIENLAVIEHARLDLDGGFTCLTGETGAGKSILLDAVGLLVGARASVEMVRTGASYGLVQGAFADVSDDTALLLLQEQGIPAAEGDVVVSREVWPQGKTVARVNGRLVTVSFLRMLGARLVQQHGQHDAAALMHADEQLRLVDRFGGETAAGAMRRYREAYEHARDARRRLHQAQHGAHERARRIDVLRFETEEIAAAHLKSGEDVRLRKLRARLAHASRLHEMADDVYDTLYEGVGRSASVQADLHRLQSEIAALCPHDDSLQELLDYVETAQANLAEATEFVRHYRDELAFDPAKLERLETRLALIDGLLRKYGATVDDVLAYETRARQELDDCLGGDEHVSALAAAVAAADEQLTAAAHALRSARQAVVLRLQGELEQRLSQLRMPHIQIVIQLEETEFGPEGADAITMLLSANAGEQLRPLAKIASGGELSRIMLALHAALADAAPQSTLIFDEIDAGISGRAATAVARQMAELGMRQQVLCVTHLPQMAAQAQSHILIEKSEVAGRTQTAVRVLSGEQRETELARMIAGEHLTDSTVASARDMLKKAHAQHGAV